MGRLLIRGGHYLGPHGVDQGDLLAEGERIRQVGGSVASAGGNGASGPTRVLNASGSLVLPGLISAHSHVTTVLDRGLTDNLPLDRWMIYTIHGAPPYSADERYVVAAAGAIELLEGGTTAVVEHVSVRPDRLVTEMDSVCRAFADMGLRSAVAPSYSDVPFFRSLPLALLPPGVEPGGLDLRPPADPDSLMASLEEFAVRWKGRHPLIKVMFGPSNPQRCSRALLEATRELASRQGTPIHMHLLETRSQAVAARFSFGGSSVRYLWESGFLAPDVSLAHGVWLAEEEIALLASAGCQVVHNPVSNVRLGSGVAPVRRLLDEGVPVALGVDGPGSNDSLEMWETLKTAAIIHKLRGAPEEWVGAGETLDMDWSGGRAVIGERIGSLEPGFLADVVLLESDFLYLEPRSKIREQIVYGDSRRAVRTVIVGGEVLVENGRCVHPLRDELLAEAGRIRKARVSDLAERDRVLAGLEPFFRELERGAADFPLGFDRRLA